MPNHIDNVLSIVGPAAEASRFRAAAVGVRPPTGDRPGSANYGPPGPPSVFNFHSLVPLPEEYSRVPYGDGGARQGIDIERDAWGIKWGAYNPGPVVEDPGCLTYRFRTAWSEPSAFLAKLAPRWPLLTFRLSYGGEGPCRGVGLWHGTLAEFADDGWPREGGWPDYPREADYTRGEQFDDDAHWRAAEVVTHKCRADHPRRLALWRAGATLAADVPDGVLADWLEEVAGWPLHAAMVRTGVEWLEG